MSGSVQVHAAPHMPRMMGPPPRYPPPSQMNHHHHSSPHHGHRQRLAYQPYRLFPRPPPPGAAALGSGNAADGSEYDGRRLRKSLVRKTVDYNAAVIKQIQVSCLSG
jgi:polyadenylation factor subunit 2